MCLAENSPEENFGNSLSELLKKYEIEKSPDLSFIDKFICNVDLKEVKSLFSDFLLEYFNSQNGEGGAFMPDYRQQVLFNFKLVSCLLDHLHELQVQRYGIN
jgi:hypothetical protein